MTDKELLELAAKAGEIKGEYVSWCYNGFKDGIREPNDKSSRPWNPLTDDGDALRLAVKLKINLSINNAVRVDYSIDEMPTLPLYEHFEPCQYAATRRAIVRAAAEIGKTL